MFSAFTESYVGEHSVFGLPILKDHQIAIYKY